MGVLYNGTSGNDVMGPYSNADGSVVVFAGAGNDIIETTGSPGKNTAYFSGDDGIDTTRFLNAKSTDCDVRIMTNGFKLFGLPSVYYMNGRVQDSIDTERIEFTDKKIAADFWTIRDPMNNYGGTTFDGNATVAARLLGMSFGVDGVHNPTYAGIVLRYLDAGGDATVGAWLLVQAAGGTTNDAAVRLLWKNLFHADATAEQVAPLVGAIEHGDYTVAQLAKFVADHDITATNIDLVGMSSYGGTGLEYI